MGTTKSIGATLIADTLKKLSLENTANTVLQRSELLKQKEEISEIHAGYSQIIHEIMQQKDEAILIAESYKSELERVQISDEDIAHLNETARAILNILSRKMLLDKELGEDAKIIGDLLNTFISTSTLRTLQLLGFNFKEAIGEPLTKLVSNFISGKYSQLAHNEDTDAEFSFEGEEADE